MLEHISSIATIIGAIIAFIALFLTGAQRLHKSRSKQIAKVSGKRNSVNQSINVQDK